MKKSGVEPFNRKTIEMYYDLFKKVKESVKK